MEEIWKEFALESQKCYSYVTITETSFKEIGKTDDLAENLSKVLLREKIPANKDNSPKVNSLFNIDKSSTLTPDYINLFRSLLSYDLNNPNISATLPSVSADNDGNVTISSYTGSVAHYKFLGWSFDKNATTATYQNGETINITTTWRKMILY